jgi:hypothetical protein
METAKAFHYSWPSWLSESPIIKAKLIAHELEKGMRDAYNFEQRMDSKENTQRSAPWDVIQKRFFK